MRQETTGNAPAIVVSETDHERLVELATAMSDRQPEVAEELLEEMDRAEVVPPDAVPPHVVGMGSTVEYEAGGQSRRVTLVFPGDADIATGRISVFTPIGTALIGLAEGQSIAWTARDGKTNQLTVRRVIRPDG